MLNKIIIFKPTLILALVEAAEKNVVLFQLSITIYMSMKTENDT